MGATANFTPLVKPSTNPHAGYRPSADWPNLCAFGIRRVDSPDAMNRAILPPVALRDRVFLHPITWKLHQKVQKYVYPHLTRSLGAHDILFINWAYEQDPPMALALEASDEPYRYCIQLYHRTATQADLSGKRVLEVGCGHGGGASYLMRALHPSSYTGLDLNPAGIAFCRKRHNLAGLEFVQGDAENLPFTDESFEAVINIESSIHYRRFPRFLAEVARVLRPGGHFLYADFRPRYAIAAWEAALANAPMRMLSQSEINAEVARGMRLGRDRSTRAGSPAKDLSAQWPPGLTAKMERVLQSGGLSYRLYCLANA
jgi:fatty-acid O-methyltransferase